MMFEAVSTKEYTWSRMAQRLPGCLQQQALLCIHGNCLWLRNAKEAAIEGLGALYEAPKAFVETGLIPTRVHVPSAWAVNSRVAQVVLVHFCSQPLPGPLTGNLQCLLVSNKRWHSL